MMDPGNDWKQVLGDIACLKRDLPIGPGWFRSLSSGFRQIGHICILGSRPNNNFTGPSVTVESRPAVVSVTTTLSVINRPSTAPWNRAGNDGPTATG